MRQVVTALLVGGLVAAGAVTTKSADGQNPPRPAADTPSPETYTFPSGAGLLFFYVRPDHAAEFESVAARLAEVLGASDDPVRKQQAASWRMFRSVEAHADRIYVFAFDPAVAGADYDPVKILSDAVPAEVQDLYAKLKSAIVKVERMGLERLR